MFLVPITGTSSDEEVPVIGTNIFTHLKAYQMQRNYTLCIQCSYLPQRLQCILLRIHQYKVRIIYKSRSWYPKNYINWCWIICINHMDIEKMRPLACESINWIVINADIESHIKTVWHVLSSRKTMEDCWCRYVLYIIKITFVLWIIIANSPWSKWWNVYQQTTWYLYVKISFQNMSCLRR